jgi:hypothetical protein
MPFGTTNADSIDYFNKSIPDFFLVDAGGVPER